jgi:predicted nuclease with TOPRIM domain
VLKREAAQLASENNQLHLRLIKETEHSDLREREHYQQLKGLEGRVAELSFWKAKTQERFAALEAEKEGLRGRLQELLSDGAPDHCAGMMPSFC